MGSSEYLKNPMLVTISALWAEFKGKVLNAPRAYTLGALELIIYYHVVIMNFILYYLMIYN